MIGRKQDLAALSALVTDPQTRLVTITGAGGIGKTRLSLQLCQEVADDFSDGCLFVDLVPLRKPDLIAQAIGIALDVSLEESDDGGAAILERLSALNALLVLDNFEHLLEAGAFVLRLIAACPDVVVLATSRQRIGIESESVFELKSLSAPDQFAPVTLESASRSESVQLFLQRAQAADRHFELTQQSAGDVAAICRRLDGLPLAIELAASRIAEIPLNTMLWSFTRILPLLENLGPERDPRHRTMRHTIEWSYAALSPDEQELFRLLSVFPGAATVNSIQSVVASYQDPFATTLSHDQGALLVTLGSLVRKQLLTRTDWESGEPRFGMLQTIREFGLEQLGTSGLESAARDAHACCFVKLANEIRMHLHGPETARWIRIYDHEIDNFRAALDWLCESSAPGDTRALELANGIARAWLWKGQSVEANRWYRRVLQVTGDGVTEAHARAYINLGHLAQGERMSAYSCYERSLALYRQLQNLTGAAGALNCLGMISIEMGDLDQAAAQLKESAKLFSTINDDSGLAYCSFHLGTLAIKAGRYSEAQQELDTARTLFEFLGDAMNATFSILKMGQIYRLQSRGTEAEQLVRWALARCKATNISQTIPLAHLELGLIALEQGHPSRAADEFREVIRLSLETSASDDFLIGALDGMARLLSMAGRHQEAAQLQSSVDRWIVTSKYSRTQEEAQSVAKIVKAAKKELGPERFTFSWNQGQLQAIESAAQSALQIEFAPATTEQTPAAGASSQAQLTAQEVRILCHIAAGEKNRQVAEELFISERTVAVHVQNILRKLNADNRTHASAIAFQTGICRS